MKSTRTTLYLQNTSAVDVGLDDLCLVIKSGVTVDVFAANPDLTRAHVEGSLATGSAGYWIGRGLIRVVKRRISNTPMILSQIKQSNQPMRIQKTKSSIIIKPESLLDVEDERLDFADYGIDEAAVKPLPALIKNTGGAITVGPQESVVPVRSIKAIAAGEDAVENAWSADRVISSGAKVLREDGTEGEVVAGELDGAIVMEVA